MSWSNNFEWISNVAFRQITFFSIFSRQVRHISASTVNHICCIATACLHILVAWIFTTVYLQGTFSSNFSWFQLKRIILIVGVWMIRYANGYMSPTSTNRMLINYWSCCETCSISHLRKRHNSAVLNCLIIWLLSYTCPVSWVLIFMKLSVIHIWERYRYHFPRT